MTRHWYRFRVWLHWFRYHCEPLPFDDHVVFVCDCGGHALVYRNLDATNRVTDASCPAWAWMDRARRLPMPTAMVLP